MDPPTEANISIHFGFIGVKLFPNGTAHLLRDMCCKILCKSCLTELRAGLEGHPETPDAVGEPATDAVLGHEAGCK